MATKKVRRKKFNILKFLVFILFLYIIISLLYRGFTKPIKNIIVLNTINLTDEEVIETAKIEKYPSYIKTLSYSIEKKLEKNELIKEAKVKKKWGYIVEIDITEYKVLFQIRSNGLYVLENGSEVELSHTVNGVPVLINYVEDKIYGNLVKKFSGLDRNVINKISEIEYSPVEFDKERFVLYMNDGNMVYITLGKIKEFNKYLEIKKQLNGKTGILYLDSGNYFEIKE